MVRPRLVRCPAALGWGLLLGALGLGLALTNPGPAAFEEFASARLALLLREELCREDGLPLVIRLVVQDCPALVESQRPVLGKLAALQTRRRNFVLMSLYRTDLGGQQLLPQWRLPRYEALTLGVAGKFLVLRAKEHSRDGQQERQAWLPANP